ncbi:MAG: helicase [Gemmatimonadetes bacterium]|nr:helicase [Gemmatimonadota bacterium]
MASFDEPAAVRSEMVRALRLDLVGPDREDDLSAEMLRQAPSRWYLTGFLVPLGAPEEQRSDIAPDDEPDALEERGGTDDAVPPEPASARRAFLPSSIGLSVLIGAGTDALDVAVRWGDYRREGGDEAGGPTEEEPERTEENEGPAGRRRVWRRQQREAAVRCPLPGPASSPSERPLPGSGGLTIVVSERPIPPLAAGVGQLPAGTRAVSIFLVNRRPPAEGDRQDEAFAFQATLEVRSAMPFVPRPDPKGLESEDWDERVADLQYRDVVEYAVGHGVASEADVEVDGSCRGVRTTWVPIAQVERVAAEVVEGVELGMEALATLTDGPEARARLGAFVTGYMKWIDEQDAKAPSSPERRRETGEELLQRARTIARRVDAGIGYLGDDPNVLEAFRIANRAMAAAARRRDAIRRGVDPAAVAPPAWRPFQLAFLLMSLPGIANPSHADREVVDLLFFPTGGGKTEAYLGLAAFTLVLRRLRNPGLASAGVTVLMRYTLRLLTLDQLSRAAALICALELERQKDLKHLGGWPFEIGLWVGLAATPNRMGARGDNDRYSARAKTIAFKNDTRKPAPIPLEECPWCGTKFSATSFSLVPDDDRPRDLRVTCANRRCDFTRNQPLPILGVDEPIYRRLPCFLIATVDKFAAMPWTGRVGALFGRVDRADRDGFYGPCDPGRGTPLDARLRPPELIVQDELHLISGPLGTMVGLYETALDALSTVEKDGPRIRPKIIASTATVRRADRQIRSLFARRVVDIFPPPGPDRRHSFFARVHSPEESQARLYVGVAAQGRNPKVILLRTYLALLGAGQKAYEGAGGKRRADNPADPYMTLVGYFNSLRELGGSRRIVEDEVTTRLTGYARRRREGENSGSFANRRIAYDVVELTSRVSTDRVAASKRRLALPFTDPGHVDVAMATNMISVGLDITRLGLMVVLGQPKTAAEYIQATSRVGRDPERPGLVVTLLNIHKPRDRSHYERFGAYHASFYRSVEATGVTPFSPQALDRGLPGTMLSLARLGHAPLTEPLGAERVGEERARLDFVVRTLEERARLHDLRDGSAGDELAAKVGRRVKDLLDEWEQIVLDYRRSGVHLQYQTEEGGARRLLYEFLHPELRTLPRQPWRFRANRSLRDVEGSVNLWVRTLDDVAVPLDEEGE